MMFLRTNKQPILLAILDGWGVAPAWGGNAISQAKTPFFDKVWQSFPRTTLKASGEAVGLPGDSPGNSEAGHLNIGAGWLLHQDQTLIDDEIAKKTFFTNKDILKAITHAQNNNSNIHLMGLLSKTGTHSHINHLFAVMALLKSKGVKTAYIHLFSDGRDSDPLSGIEMVDEVEQKIKELGIGEIVSISGRFYAMDRDNRWGRVARAYNAIVKGEANTYETARAGFTSSYSVGTTDEFIEPRLITGRTGEKITIKDNDSIIFFNFRSDRAREITEAFLDEKLPEFKDRVKLKNLYFVSFVIYDDHLPSVQAFKPEGVDQPIAKAWSDLGLRQFHIAETEKYPHVTYFINGGREKPYPGESRKMIPSSRKYPTYDRIPQMCAEEVTAALLSEIKRGANDCYIVNYANPDMVGHTGNLGATIQAVECVDRCMNRVTAEIVKHNGRVLVCADHGNAELMINPQTGEPHTEHSTNPVPFILVGNAEAVRGVGLKNGGALSSIAPTVLELMGAPIPTNMTSPSLAVRTTGAAV